jgi:polysaccharide export outer membrane protein
VNRYFGILLLVAFILADTIASGAPPAQPPETVDPGYRLGPEDLLYVSVWKDESLTREVLVRPDGMISFPLVGDLPAEGKTVEGLRADLVKRLSPFLPDPTLAVAVLKVNTKIYVVGKVSRPGEYLVGRPVDVMQALSLAGGLTPFASENKIRILRRENGAQQTYLFRFGDVKKGESLEQNIVLQRGDVVIVP